MIPPTDVKKRDLHLVVGAKKIATDLVEMKYLESWNTEHRMTMFEYSAIQLAMVNYRGDVRKAGGRKQLREKWKRERSLKIKNSK
ncbi:MAG: hypothetical protein AAF571_03395 [Verrucomicrobiota bacterium]